MQHSHNRRALTGIALSLAMSCLPALAMCPPACAQDGSTKAFGAPPLPTDTFQPAAAGAAAVQGVTDKEVRFGMTGPFSGPSKDLGRQVKVGLDTAFAVANDAGGVAGRKVTLTSADDGYDPAKAMENVRQLRDRDHVFGFVGNVGTPTAAATLPYALQNGMPYLSAFSGASLLRNVPPDRLVFNYRPSYAEETEATVGYLMRVKGFKAKEIAVFSQDDAYGQSGLDGVSKALRAAQGGFSEPGLKMTYPRNTVDVAAAVAQMKAVKPGAVKAVIMVATYRAAAKFVEYTRPLHPGLLYTDVSFVGSTSLSDELTMLGPTYAEGAIVTQVVPPVEGFSKAVMDYKAALAKYFPGERPDYVSFEGYVDGEVVLAGLRAAGRNLTPETLAAAMEGLHGLDLGLGAPLSFSAADHQASHKVWGTVLDKAGHYSPLDLQ